MKEEHIQPPNIALFLHWACEQKKVSPTPIWTGCFVYQTDGDRKRGEVASGKDPEFRLNKILLESNVGKKMYSCKRQIPPASLFKSLQTGETLLNHFLCGSFWAVSPEIRVSLVVYVCMWEV